VSGTLEAGRLVKAYAGVPALGPLDLSLGEGTLVALTGHNGAGKSTLLRLGAGLLDRSGGELVVCGERPGSPAARRLVSFVPDTPVLYEDLGVGELVEYVARLHDPSGWRPRAERVIERLGLGARVDQLPGQLSRGLRQRVALALGLARPFSLLLLDEPFGSLDDAGAAVVAELIAEHVAAGATAIVSSHQLDLLAMATVRVALRDGVVVDDDGEPVRTPRERPPAGRRGRRRGIGSR
jgi:ABC-type multidrug transport system ATPase subunit